MWLTIFIWHFISGFMGFCFKKIAIYLATLLFPDEDGLHKKIKTDPYPQWVMLIGSLGLGYIVLIAILYDAVVKPFINLLFTKKKWWEC